MVKWGMVVSILMSTSSGLTVAGMAIESDSCRWLGILGMAIGGLGITLAIKGEARRQKLSNYGSIRVWSDDAWIPPSWVVWTIRVMMLALIVDAQLLLNKIALLG